MSPNESVRAEVKVVMADGGGSARRAGAVADALVDLVLEGIGVTPPGAGVEPIGLSLREDHRSSTGELAAARAATIMERLGPLVDLADSAERYRRAVRNGKGTKKARKRLFDAVEAWEAARAGDLTGG
jgi:hypothetical protein